MKAISLWQPWASLCVLPGPNGRAVKTIETRSWPTKYRGPLAVHAAKREPDQALRLGDYVVGTVKIPEGSCMSLPVELTGRNETL